LLEDEIEQQIWSERYREPRECPTIAQPQPDQADYRERQNGCRKPPDGPRRDQRVVQRVDELTRGRRRPQHADAAEVLRTLSEQGAPVRARSAADDDERNEPREGSGDIEQYGDGGLGTGDWPFFQPPLSSPQPPAPSPQPPHPQHQQRKRPPHGPHTQTPHHRGTDGAD